jgi:osmotically-inducible protein OsmY
MQARSGLLVFTAATVTTLMLLNGCGKPAPTASAGAPTTSTVSGSESNVADVDVTTNVKTALLQTPNLQGHDIAVVTTKGDVRLTGVLDTQAQVDEALTVARATAGVHAIHDELSVKK